VTSNRHAGAVLPHLWVTAVQPVTQPPQPPQHQRSVTPKHTPVGMTLGRSQQQETGRQAGRQATEPGNSGQTGTHARSANGGGCETCNSSFSPSLQLMIHQHCVSMLFHAFSDRHSQMTHRLTSSTTTYARLLSSRLKLAWKGRMDWCNMSGLVISSCARSRIAGRCCWGVSPSYTSTDGALSGPKACDTSLRRTRSWSCARALVGKRNRAQACEQ
jgi:hypothetical protein